MRIAYGSNHNVTLMAEELLITLRAGKDSSGNDNTETQEESNLSNWIPKSAQQFKYNEFFKVKFNVF